MVARDRARDAARIEARRHVAESRGVKRAPVAAMDEQREWRVAGRIGKEQVDLLARARPIGEAELDILVARHPLAIGRGIALPAREDLAVLGHACAIVVFDVVVDHSASSPLESRPWMI